MNDRTGKIASDEAASRERCASYLRKLADQAEAGLVDGVEVSACGPSGATGGLWLLAEDSMQNITTAVFLLGLLDIRSESVRTAHHVIQQKYAQQQRPDLVVPSGAPS